ncbi:hypothetical protein GcM1_247207 [Golovinomyces cichoracearum]|uniref:Uncharacterized protein n=1 Tax=Golovinomyces cichoracearum TaxID=62708 RepID=A0A420IDZ0_9PEZI|nr:hypothetical protein GcM1_247207 [Golovinomyces cichoracearum]
MEATQANVAAARGVRARRGRCGGRGNQKKAELKRKPITKDNMLVEPALVTPQNQYPDSSIYSSASQQPYYQTLQHESSSLHLRDQSVPFKVLNPPVDPVLRASWSPTSHSTEEQDNDIAKNRRGLKYLWLYEREFVMLRAFIEAKHSGLQTGSSVREIVCAEAQKAVDFVVVNGNLAPPITAAQMSNKWGDWKKWWPDYEAHYGTSIVKRHTSGLEKNSSGREFNYPGIDTSVLVSFLDAMRDHYNAYPKCRRFRKHLVNHVELLEQLFSDKLTDGRNSMKITDVAREGNPKRKRSSKVDVRKQAILKSTEEAGFERLAMAINRQSKSKMGLAMQRVEKLWIFKDNIEAIGCLYEAFFCGRKEGGLLSQPTYKDDRLVASNQIGVETARKRRRVSEEAGNSDLHEDIDKFEDIEEGNGDFDEFIGEVGSEDEFLERFSQETAVWQIAISA